jgi:hypothetical protein
MELPNWLIVIMTSIVSLLVGIFIEKYKISLNNRNKENETKLTIRSEINNIKIPSFEQTLEYSGEKENIGKLQKKNSGSGIPELIWPLTIIFCIVLIIIGILIIK